MIGSDVSSHHAREPLPEWVGMVVGIAIAAALGLAVHLLRGSL
jgi:hypothetical protein